MQIIATFQAIKREYLFSFAKSAIEYTLRLMSWLSAQGACEARQK